MAFSQNVRSATQISSFVSAQVQTRGLAPKTANRYREILSALQLGTYSLTFGANNGVGTAANQAFTLSVYQAPAITSASTATFTVGTSASFAVTTTGFPNAVTGDNPFCRSNSPWRNPSYPLESLTAGAILRPWLHKGL